MQNEEIKTIGDFVELLVESYGISLKEYESLKFLIRVVKKNYRKPTRLARLAL